MRTIIARSKNGNLVLTEYVNWENLNQLLSEGKTPIFEDTGEEVPVEQYEELLKPKGYTIEELLMAGKEVI